MGPIRREQICRAAAAVIARAGFSGTTMRLVAKEAGVSTGMLNHYFENRQELLNQTLVYVCERTEERYRRATRELPAGVARLEALLDSALADDEEMLETWRVWIDASAEAVRSPALRPTIEARRASFFGLVDSLLDGAPRAETGGIPASVRLDAMLTGLAAHALTAGAPLSDTRVRDEVIRAALGEAALRGDRRLR